MQVGQLMQQAVQSCTPADPLNLAAQIMWDYDCGCVPVVEGGRVVAMITDRDVCMAAYFSGAPLTVLTVGDAMSHTLVTCHPDDTLASAEALMRTHQIRRLPVVDDDKLVGLLSLSDLAQELGHEVGSKTKQVAAKEVADTMAAITCRRPSPALTVRAA